MTRTRSINRTTVLLVAIALAVGALTPIGEAAKQLVLPRNSVRTEHIVNRTIQPGDLSKAAIDYINAGAPEPRGAGVTANLGLYAQQFRILAPRLVAGDKVVGQLQYIGGACPFDDVRLDAAFFAATGLIVDADSWSSKGAVPQGVRLPFELKSSSTESAIRAELVLSRVSCVTP
jgi:hypothetical protein